MDIESLVKSASDRTVVQLYNLQERQLVVLAVCAAHILHDFLSGKAVSEQALYDAYQSWRQRSGRAGMLESPEDILGAFGQPAQMPWVFSERNEALLPCFENAMVILGLLLASELDTLARVLKFRDCQELYEAVERLPHLRCSEQN